MPRGNPRHWKHTQGQVDGWRPHTNIVSVRVVNADDFPAGGGGGGTGLPPTDPADAAGKGVPTTWFDFTLPLGQFVGQIIQVLVGGTYFQPDGAPIVLVPRTRLWWQPQWVPLPPPPPADPEEAVGRGVPEKWLDPPDLPEGVFRGQLIQVDGPFDWNQPGGGVLSVTQESVLWWDVTQWVLSDLGASVAELPPLDDVDAVSLGVPVLWLGTSGTTVPVGQFVGQIMQVGTTGLFQPDGTTPIVAGVGDIILWTGALWLTVDMVTQDDLDLFVAATLDALDTKMDKTADLSDVNSVPDARANLDVYSTAEVDALLGDVYTETEVDALLDGKLAKVANLSDVDNVSDARTNLDVPSIAEMQAGDLARMLKSANLSDVASVPFSRTNLDVYSTAEVDALLGGVYSETEIDALLALRLLKTANLSDVADVLVSRSNLDVYSKLEVDGIAALKLAKASNLSDVASAPTSRTNLDVYSTAEVDALVAGGGLPPSNDTDSIAKGIPVAYWVGNSTLPVAPETSSQLLLIVSPNVGQANTMAQPAGSAGGTLAVVAGDVIYWDIGLDLWQRSGATWSPQGVMTGRLGTMLRLPPSFVEHFEERTQHPNYWVTDAPAGGTIGTVATNPTPQPILGGVGWVRLTPGTVNHVAMWPTVSDAAWPTLTSGWITLAFRFYLRNITSGTISMMGLGGPMVAGATPANHWAITYSGGTWFMSLAETSESTSTAAFTSAPPTPTNSDAAWWGLLQVESTGHVIAMVRSPSGTEYVTARTLPAWGDPASITRQIQPWFLANLGSPLQEMFLDQLIMWDGATLQMSTAPIAS